MIGAKVKTVDQFDKVAKAEKEASFKNLGHAAGGVRLIARRSIRTSDEPSQPGTPPHTSGRKRLRNAILFAVEKQLGRATIGPSEEIAGQSGGAMEHGGLYRGTFYPVRPFMGPALVKAAPRMPEQWANSIGPS
jgi:hypothetical protein